MRDMSLPPRPPPRRAVPCPSLLESQMEPRLAVGEMPGEGQEEVEESQTAGELDCSFHRHRDDPSQLSFHASSEPFHDPVSGLLYSRKGVDSQNEIWEPEKSTLYEAAQSSAMHLSEISDSQCNPERDNSGAIESMSPPSEWLEETLINLYLSGYSESMACTDDSVNNFPVNESEAEDAHQLLCDHSSEEIVILDKPVSSSITGDADGVSGKRESEPIEGVDDIWDEENWRAQYGQVTESGDFDGRSCPIKDLWDWHMDVQTIGKKRKHRTARVVGRLVKEPSKLHPSIPSGGALFKTSSICETRLDLVRVTSGHVYRLRNPSVRYLASLSTYDSSNPTKDWGFPDLSVKLLSVFCCSSDESKCSYSKIALGCGRFVTKREKPLPSSNGFHCRIAYSFDQKDEHVFRDRAAERRALHGGFGVGPGQKSTF